MSFVVDQLVGIKRSARLEDGGAGKGTFRFFGSITAAREMSMPISPTPFGT